METGDVLAIVAATVVAILCGVLIAVLYVLAGTLRELRDDRRTRCATRPSRCSTTRTMPSSTRRGEVDRIDRLVGSAERINGAVDGAQRMAYKTLASPVVKAMAFGTGVSRAAQRIRAGEGDTVAPAARPEQQEPVGPQAGRPDDVQAPVLARRRVHRSVSARRGRSTRRLRRIAARYAPPEVVGPLGRHHAGRGRRRTSRDAGPRSRAQGELGARAGQ